ncbi:hypothetical protein WJR50_09600 [Catalinimonas sp. 4WD22]|uniref:hypothetical protein n=1 Tax=Catalinimonas locisalis TaxID=3133978 RepID=UPI003101898E
MLIRPIKEVLKNPYYFLLIRIYRYLYGLKISRENIVHIKQLEETVHQKNDLYKKGGLPAADFQNLINYKNSDTLFVLGSGATVNNLSTEDWDTVRNFDSLALNFFLAHPHTPTFLQIELGGPHFSYFKDLYLKKESTFKKVPIIISLYEKLKEFPFHYLDYIKNPFISSPRRFNYFSENDLREIFSWYEKFKREKDFLFHYRGSLITAISLGTMLNYKRIILLGIDLNSTEYFYDHPMYHSKEVLNLISYRKAQEKERYLAIANQLEEIHPTANKNWVKENMTIDEIIKVYKEEVLDKRNIELYVTNKKSLLYPALDYIDIKALNKYS